MKLSSTELDELAGLAILAATTAGQMIAESRPDNVQRKAGGGASLASQVVTEIDRRSEDMILDILGPTIERFDLGLLTEERVDDSSRLTADYFWCVDPLDGTLPFIEGVPGYAVSIGLVDRSGAPCLGVVYDPLEATLFHAIAGAGAFRDQRPFSVGAGSPADVLSVFADRSFLEQSDHDVIVERFEQIAIDMGLSGHQVRTSAGAVMNACGVLESGPACYVKFPKPAGGGSLWDFAATACLFNESGAVATDIDGNRLDLNRTDSTFMNHRGVLFATDVSLAERIRAYTSGQSSVRG